MASSTFVLEIIVLYEVTLISNRIHYSALISRHFMEKAGMCSLCVSHTRFLHKTCFGGYRITPHKRAPHLVVHALISGYIFKTGNIQKSTIFGLQLHVILTPDPKTCHF